MLKGRVDHLKKLGVVFVTLNGGEPLLNKKSVDLVRYIKEQGMTPMMNTNGFVLSKKVIEELNEAGLYGMQISCDGLKDNDVSIKSIDRLRPKFELLKVLFILKRASDFNFNCRCDGL